jgi:NAD-dependent SIR2 family protein deacetylase
MASRPPGRRKTVASSEADRSAPVRAAAAAVLGCEALVITAGAGMGVDSGLPDFRGDHGFWKAYPAYERLGLSFVEAANPVHFERDPAFGWGFYGHRLGLYRRTEPHGGFRILLSWAERLRVPWFVATSNVDGQFQKAGYGEDRIYEIHGSIHHLQCTTPCSGAIWPNREEIPVDPATMRAAFLPRCPRCGAVSRPNVLMFGDWAWVGDRSAAQEERFNDFLFSLRGKRVAVIETGAGTAVPSIRALGERLGVRAGVTVVRINPREPGIAAPHVSLPEGALRALEAVDRELEAGGMRGRS